MSFVKGRIPFAVLDGVLCINENTDDTRTCKEWLHGDFGVGEAAWATAVRGYIFGSRVQLFTGFDYHEVDLHAISFSYILRLVNRCAELSNCMQVSVYNGVIAGDTDEVWPPKEIVATMMVSRPLVDNNI